MGTYSLVFSVIFGILFLAIVGIYLWGKSLPQDLKFSKTTIIDAPIELVWKTTRDIKGQVSWRTDINSIQILDEAPGNESWIENPKQGPAIQFETTNIEPLKQWRMDIRNQPSFSAYWIGNYESVGSNKTKVEFTEYVSYRSPWMRVFAKLVVDLDGTMDLYMKDLLREIENRINN